jgi:flagellar biosynthetic protein FliR
MVTITSAQWMALLAIWIYPLARILALLAAVPLFANAALPLRLRLVFGLALTLAIAPLLPPPPPGIEPASGAGLLILAQQILIGVAMGMVMRVMVGAIALAGELISTQMGLGFATMYDPMSTSQTAVTSEFISLLATLIFLSMDGHLLLIGTLVQSFQAMPIMSPPASAGFFLNVVEWGRNVFAYGLLLSLPVVVTLIIVNVALSVLSRAAPQLNLMAVGFPITLSVGLILLGVTLPHLIGPLQRIFTDALGMMLGIFLGN